MIWHSIETAPKEQFVLVSASSWAYPVALMLTLTYPRGDNGNPTYEWQDESGDGDQTWQPTHWMPLPLPPDKGLTS